MFRGMGEVERDVEILLDVKEHEKWCKETVLEDRGLLKEELSVL